MTNNIVLAGGSGFLGLHIAKRFAAEGWKVHILSRQAGPQGSPYRTWVWDGETLGPWTEALDGARVLVNLTGRSVNCRYNEPNRREILGSRVNSVRVLAEAVAMARARPKAWIQAGTLAIYGNAGDRVCGEEAPHGTGFSVKVSEAWETAFSEVGLDGLRKVLLRIGFVLAPGEGAMKSLEAVTRNFLGGTIGNGRQFISWIHIDDLVEMVWQAAQDAGFSGSYNATGPLPVRNAEFMEKLRRALRRPWSPPAPALALHLAAWFMGTEAELALTGRRCLPRRLIEKGFHFRYWDLQESLRALYGR